MPVKFPAPATGGERWSRRASAASPDYQAGVQAAAGKWQPAATAGKANYDQSVQAAIAKGSFVAGIARAGDQKWVSRTTTVGPARFSQGVQAAQPAYEAGVSAIWQKVAATTLPTRGPRRAEGNYQRAVTMAKAFAQAKG